jgi:hypothetical protein
MFFLVSLITAGLQVMLVQVGGDYLRTTPMRAELWFICIALGFIGIPLGFLMRLLPVKEDPNVFFVSGFTKGEKPPGISPDATAMVGRDVEGLELQIKKSSSIEGLPPVAPMPIPGRERSGSDLSDVSIVQIDETAPVEDHHPPVMHVVPIKKSYDYFDVPSYNRAKSGSHAAGSGEKGISGIPVSGSLAPEGGKPRAGSFCGDDEGGFRPPECTAGSGSIELQRTTSSGDGSKVAPHTTLNHAVGELSRNDSDDDDDKKRP